NCRAPATYRASWTKAAGDKRRFTVRRGTKDDSRCLHYSQARQSVARTCVWLAARGGIMIARLIRLILAAELLTGLGIGLLMHTRANWPWVAVVTMTLAWPLLLHGWLIGLQSLTAAWHRHREGQTGAGAPGWLAALQAWWCETLAS